MDLLNKLMSLQEEDEDLAKVVRDYWNQNVDENETQRYPNMPKDIRDAFKFLKRTYKYHEYDKRDGSIVNKLLLPDNQIEFNKAEIDKLLLGVMKTAQLKHDQPLYDKPIPFPVLPELTYEEYHQILSGISHEKAMAYNGVTDDIFTKENINKSAKVFRDLWTNKWEEHIENEEHFSTKKTLSGWYRYNDLDSEFKRIENASILK